MKEISYRIKRINELINTIPKNKEPDYYYNLLYRELHEVSLIMLRNKFKIPVEILEDVLQDYFIGTNKYRNSFITAIRNFKPDLSQNFFNYMYKIVLLRSLTAYKEYKLQQAVIDSERLQDSDIEYFLKKHFIHEELRVDDIVINKLNITTFKNDILRIICTSNKLIKKYAIALFISFFLNINEPQVNLSVYLDEIFFTSSHTLLNQCQKRGIRAIIKHYPYLQEYGFETILKYMHLEDLEEVIDLTMPIEKNIFKDLIFKRFTLKQMHEKYGDCKSIINKGIMKLYEHYKGRYYETRQNNCGRIKRSCKDTRSINAICGGQ